MDLKLLPSLRPNTTDLVQTVFEKILTVGIASILLHVPPERRWCFVAHLPDPVQHAVAVVVVKLLDRLDVVISLGSPDISGLEKKLLVAVCHAKLRRENVTRTKTLSRKNRLASLKLHYVTNSSLYISCM